MLRQKIERWSVCYVVGLGCRSSSTSLSSKRDGAIAALRVFEDVRDDGETGRVEQALVFAG
jgi:hypothetical protein